ncbi:hypothetical protein GCM10022140_50060 [Rhodococcus aetherivorans]
MPAGSHFLSDLGGELGGEERAQFVAERELFVGELQVHGGLPSRLCLCERSMGPRPDPVFTLHDSRRDGGSFALVLRTPVL